MPYGTVKSDSMGKILELEGGGLWCDHIVGNFWGFHSVTIQHQHCDQITKKYEQEKWLFTQLKLVLVDMF